MHLVKFEAISIPASRQRKEIESDSIVDLANSISSIGLIHPIVVNQDKDQIVLVAGERRLQAMETIWGMGDVFTHGGSVISEGQVPCTYLTDLDPLDAMEIELEENIRRQDLSNTMGSLHPQSFKPTIT